MGSRENTYVAVKKSNPGPVANVLLVVKDRLDEGDFHSDTDEFVRTSHPRSKERDMSRRRATVTSLQIPQRSGPDTLLRDGVGGRITIGSLSV